MAVLIMRAPYLSDEASEQEHAAQIQADEREKLAFIEQYHPRWYDVDPHEDYDYVTYKIDVRRGNATNTLLCKGAADLHHGHWFINADDKCTRIKARVDGKKDPLPNADPAATITTA
ncbi:hypothetical protein EPO04_00320 [Patescibacteria group bacterium]|nr:MAG: hypothetical protein EPO04_00320 [Patescibacteria group bacterium]